MFLRFKFLVAAFGIFISSPAFSDLAIIVHPSYKAGDLSTQDVKKLFLGERRSFPDGLFAKPINHNAGSPDRNFFYTTVLGMDEDSLMRYWRRKISSGKNTQPTELGSYAEVLKTVASTNNSISYIDSSLVNNSVKVLMVLDERGMIDQ